MPTAQVTYSIVKVNMADNKLVSPPPPRMGRPGVFSSGEWDDYYELEDSVRRFIRRNLCGGELAPDQIAAEMGLDVPTFWHQLEVAVGAALDSRPVAQYDDTTASLADLMGPREVAGYFSVEVNTIAQWRKRHRDFPYPVLELSGRLIWDVRDLERWGIACGRLESDGIGSF